MEPPAGRSGSPSGTATASASRRRARHRPEGATGPQAVIDGGAIARRRCPTACRPQRFSPAPPRQDARDGTIVCSRKYIRAIIGNAGSPVASLCFRWSDSSRSDRGCASKDGPSCSRFDARNARCAKRRSSCANGSSGTGHHAETGTSARPTKMRSGTRWPIRIAENAGPRRRRHPAGRRPLAATTKNPGCGARVRKRDHRQIW